jgi:hypothetical protein
MPIDMVGLVSDGDVMTDRFRDTHCTSGIGGIHGTNFWVSGPIMA